MFADIMFVDECNNYKDCQQFKKLKTFAKTIFSNVNCYKSYDCRIRFSILHYKFFPK